MILLATFTTFLICAAVTAIVYLLFLYVYLVNPTVITAINEKGTHPYHCISQDGKGVYGWVNAESVKEGVSSHSFLNIPAELCHSQAVLIPNMLYIAVVACNPPFKRKQYPYRRRNDRAGHDSVHGRKQL